MIKGEKGGKERVKRKRMRNGRENREKMRERY